MFYSAVKGEMAGVIDVPTARRRMKSDADGFPISCKISYFRETSEAKSTLCGYALILTAFLLELPETIEVSFSPSMSSFHPQSSVLETLTNKLNVSLFFFPPSPDFWIANSNKHGA